MDIEQIDRNKLKIHLEKNDLSDFDIDFEALDYKNKQTRDIIWDLLDVARIKTGFDAFQKKIFIEAFKSPAGGCTLYFTLLNASRMPAVNREYPYIYEFSTDEDMICAAKSIPVDSIESKLFAFDGKFRLILYPNGRLSIQTKSVMSEFGNQVGFGQGAEAFTGEHGKILISKRAIETVNEYF